MTPDKTLNYEAIFTRENLWTASILSQAGKKKHYSEVIEFNKHREEFLDELYEMCRTHSYVTKDYTEFDIFERGKSRHISKLPYYPHRIFQTCLVKGTERVMLNKLCNNTYAALPKRGTHKAIRDLRRIMLDDPEGTQWCLKIDISKYFPHVNHAVLKTIVERCFDDYGIRIAYFEVIDSIEYGIPIGNYTSQFLANLYLRYIDLFMLCITHAYSRYMDDIVILGPTREYLMSILRELEFRLETDNYLKIKPNYQIFRVSDRGIDYCGYRVFHNQVMLRKGRLKNIISLYNRIKFKGFATEHDLAQLNSYYGGIIHCTPKVRRIIFNKYFREIYLSIEQTNILMRENYD